MLKLTYYGYVRGVTGTMKKTLTIFMVVMFVAFAVVMYIYWQSEEKAVMKGVLVDNVTCREKCA